MRTLIALFCLLASLEARSAVEISEAQELCANSVTGALWRPWKDEQLRAYAEEFLRAAETHATHVLLCTSHDQAPDPAWSRLLGRGKRIIFVMGINPRFAQMMTPHMRAIVAHEVGHQLTEHTGGACDRFSRSRSKEDYILCEHDADWVGANWVGKEAMIRALQATLEYRAREGVPEEHLIRISRRITLLRESP